MPFDSNPGTSRLAGILSQRMKQESSVPLALDFGEIGGDYGLTTNTFPKTIPQSDYVVCRSLALGKAGSPLAALSGGKHEGHETGNGGHSHTVPVPQKLRSLAPGDRVLVAWIGMEAVVVDIIVPAGALSEGG